MRPNATRRKFIASTGVVASLGLAGCSGGGEGSGDDTSSDGSTSGDDGSSGDDGGDGPETYTVGHGEYEREISAADFPDELFIYAVQTGWSNWDAVTAAFEDEYGVPLHDDQRTSGEALSNIRANAGNQSYSAYNGFYPVGLQAWQDGFTTDYSGRCKP